MANPPNGHGATKNPGGLGGHTGASNGSAWRREQSEAYTETPSAARILLRSIVSDDGHFQGLEVAHD